MLKELLARREPNGRDREAAGISGGGTGEPSLRGPVERDPRTGEIVRRRI